MSGVIIIKIIAKSNTFHDQAKCLGTSLFLSEDMKLKTFSSPFFIRIQDRLAIDDGGSMSYSLIFPYFAWLECFQEKSSWCQNKLVC